MTRLHFHPGYDSLARAPAGIQLFRWGCELDRQDSPDEHGNSDSLRQAHWIDTSKASGIWPAV